MSTGVGDVERAAVPMEPVGKANSEYGAVVAAACPKMGVALGLVKCGGKSESASRAGLWCLSRTEHTEPELSSR